MRNRVILAALSAIVFVPHLVFAAPPTNFKELVNRIIGYANRFVPIILGISVIALMLGVLKYIAAGGDEKKVAEGRQAIVYGLVALFVMLSFVGLAFVIYKSLFG